MRSVDRMMETAVAERHFQSATLLVAEQGQVVFCGAYGRARLESVFDLASLTKVLATTAVAMTLVERGALDLRAPLSRYVPESAELPAGPLPLQLLLSHRSGVAAWCPFFEDPRVMRYKTMGRRKRAARSLAARQIVKRRDRETIYSDLGFILLEWAIERAGGASLGRLAKRLIYRPLSLSRTGFLPIGQSAPARWELVPTERCPWRRRRLRGEVHDDNCFVLGGEAGHAGLFSTAYDIHLLTRELVGAYAGERSIFDRQSVRRFWNHRADDPRGCRALGWDRPAKVGSSTGRHFSPRAVGHLGFTGTSLWIDLERMLWVVLLTNRVYYGRDPNPMKRFRPMLHDQIMKARGQIMKARRS